MDETLPHEGDDRGPAVIEVDNLVKRFGLFTSVDHLSMTVRKGEVFGLLGSNGAGKTTAIRMLCGLLAPTSGSARVLGIDVARDPEALKRRYRTAYEMKMVPVMHLAADRQAFVCQSQSMKDVQLLLSNHQSKKE